MKTRIRKGFVLFLGMISAVISIGFTTQVQAAQYGRVIVDEAYLYDQPNRNSGLVQTLKKDEVATISNLPTNGFYKARTLQGKIGWIEASEVFASREKPVFENELPAGQNEADNQEVKEPEPPASQTKPTRASQQKKVDRRAFDDEQDQPSSFNDGFRLLLGGGIQNSALQSFITGYSTASGELNPVTGGMVELQMRARGAFYYLVRLEYLSRTSNLVSLSSSLTQQIEQSLLPLFFGLGWSPIASEDFRLGFQVYGGLTLDQVLRVTRQQTSSDSKVTEYPSRFNFLGLASLQLSKGLSETFAVFFEASYRLLKTSDYRAPSASEFSGVPAMSLDYSGLGLRGGVEIRL